MDAPNPETTPAGQLRSPLLKAFRPRISHDELYAQGKALRDACSRQSHAEWKPVHDRHDPVQLLQRSSEGRIAELIPIRYGRMVKSPFTFYRGAALNMAADLGSTPTSGLRVQVCGDAHLSNFGAFATPERRIIFDINDLDETLPAPWEWDVKRLAASFVVAGRNNGFSESDARDAAVTVTRSYREHMAEYGHMSVLDIWYDSVDVEKVLDEVDNKEARRRFEKRVAKARARSVLEHDFPELALQGGDELPVIKDDPPLIYHARSESEAPELIQQAFASYRDTLAEHRRVLLDRYELLDLAIKVVGVGSVGTYCGVILLMAGNEDPLFLQVKQARASVLEPYAGKCQYANHGQRVVMGYQLMQSASDIFLGWTEGAAGRHFYVRQLKDMKIKALVETYSPSIMQSYAVLCGWTLARAHARTGEPAVISGYLGKGDKFEEAIGDFAVAYADQNERDYARLQQAVQQGILEVEIEEED